MRALHSRAMLLLTAVALAMLNCSVAWAHSMNQAAALLDFQTSTLRLELQLPPSRLALATGIPVTPANLAASEPGLTRYLSARIRLLSASQETWTLQLDQPLHWEVIDGAPYVVADFKCSPPAGAPFRKLVFRDDVLTDAIPSQVVLVSVRSDWNSSTFASDPDLIGILNGRERTIEIDRSTGRWTTGFGSIFHLGVRHIAEGTDHLLFLLALLLPAPLLVQAHRWGGFAGVRHSFGKILQVVTAFTIGHSLTLALAATNLVRVPSRPIEILIAVSILISAIHAIRPIFPGREAWVAAGFGLIHGLAFASTLAELGLRGWEKAASILSFNLGIESMQLVVVLCIMPSLMLLSRTSWYTPFRVLGAIFAAIAASGWIVERVAGRASEVDGVVDLLARHALMLSVCLLILAVAANLLNPSKEAHA